MPNLDYCDTCGKIKYKSKADAYNTAKRSKKHEKSEMRVYLCPFCKCWHLSHSNRKARK